MADNSAANEVLRAYLALEEPGYALLIDAPWGAGKTYFIQHSSGNSPDELRYVTLNGVADEAGFRRAILKDSLQADLLTTGTALAQTLSKLAKVEGLGQLASDYAEEALLRALPPTLVFDDLERATLPPEQLLGLINDYVEHQGKRVILLVNSEAHARKDAFLARKEKLVGRTITITPDVTAALPAFLGKITKGKGRKYLEAQTDLIADVFRQSDHGNLRLLRNALRNCAPVLDQIEDRFFDAPEAMGRFVRTYLVLFMAYARGEISAEDIANRGNWKLGTSGKHEEVKELAMYKLHEAHSSTGVEVRAHSGSVLPFGLGVSLFVDGYVDGATLNSTLANTGQFEITDENPLWKRIMYWQDHSWDDIGKIIEEAETYLFETDAIQPGPYLHVAWGLLWIEEFGGLEVDREGLVKRIKRRITELRDANGLRAAARGVDCGWQRRYDQFSYGVCLGNERRHPRDMRCHACRTD